MTASEREQRPAPAVDAISADDLDESYRIVPVFQPLRAATALASTIAGFALYEFVILNFWSAPWLGMHLRTPWPAYAILAIALLFTLAGLRIALGIWSPHAKLGISILALFACAAVGVGGGRFVSYLRRGTLNPPFTLTLKVGDRFPAFALADQNGVVHRGPSSSAVTLLYVYRGDFCPFARFELGELTTMEPELKNRGVEMFAVSADPPARSQMLANFLHTDLPLLSDTSETLLGPMGLIERHRDGEPNNSIPAFFVLDRDGVVRWIFISPFYRELPRPSALRVALDSAINSRPTQ